MFGTPLALLFLAAAADPAAIRKKYAVLVGVNGYDHARLPALRYAENDATETAEVLRGHGYEVALLTGEAGKADPARAPTKANIEAQIRRALKAAARGDAVVVGLAGHGLQFQGDPAGYFCPPSAKPFKSEADTLVSLGDVYAEMGKSLAGVKVLLVDACRDDPESGGRGVTADNAPAPPRGVAALFSCSNGEVAREHATLKHGVFFHYVLEGLRGKARDARGRVTFAGLASYVGQEVAEAVPKLIGGGARQSPNLVAVYSGEPVLVTVEPPAEWAVAPPADPAVVRRPAADGGNGYERVSESKEREGVPRGNIEAFSAGGGAAYPGTTREYWVYVPAQYDPAKPANLLVVLDGSGFRSRTAAVHVPVVLDNLIHDRAIPPTVCAFVNPGRTALPGGKVQSNRSAEYDTPSAAYAEFLEKDILSAVGKRWKVRADPAGRAICGVSSGGFAAFAAAWERPDLFGRAIVFIGSFVDIRGGNTYLAQVRRADPPKPIRVFLQAGERDLDNKYGNWFRASQEMAGALRFRKYDYRLEVGTGGHSSKHMAAAFPDALRWAWRDEK